MKTMQMEKALDSISEQLFDRSRSLSMFNLECPTCGGTISKFRDELSEREYRISGMCQKCQDEVFPEVPEE
jgi:hypothetical protein